MAFRVLWIILYFSTILGLNYAQTYIYNGGSQLPSLIATFALSIGDKSNYRFCRHATLYIYALFFLIDFIKYKSISILYYYLCAMALLFIYIFFIIASLTNLGE